ncbi:MAG: hypothetical protein PHQ50_01045 [Eubacteriales bacterium]|nr:hypothetical protein [Eubacteriales bacterium]
MAGFLAIWFVTAFKDLSAKRNSLADLEEQLHLHEALWIQVKDSLDAHASAGMLETSRMLYREAAKGYNRVLRKPMNRIPSLLLGFRTADEEHGHQNKEEKPNE